MQGFTLCRGRRYVHRAARATAHRCMSREAEKVEHSARPQHRVRIQRRHEHFHMRTGRSRRRRHRLFHQVLTGDGESWPGIALASAWQVGRNGVDASV